MALENFNKISDVQDFISNLSPKKFGEKSALDKFSDLMAESKNSGTIAAGNEMAQASALAQIPPTSQPAAPTPFRDTFMGNLAAGFIPGVAGTFRGQREEEEKKTMQGQQNALADLIKSDIPIEEKVSALARINPEMAKQFLGLQSDQGGIKQQGLDRTLTTAQTDLVNQKISDLKRKKLQDDKAPLTAGLPDNFMWEKDPTTGKQKAVKIPGLEDHINITPDFEGEQKLRKEFNSQTVEFGKINRSFGRVKASIEDPSAAGDLSLIFNFMKMLDPASVVRESEFATAQNSAAVPDRIRSFYNKIVSGQRMSKAQRKDFANRANKLFVAQRDIASQSKNAYNDLAKDYKFKPERITATFQPIDEIKEKTSDESIDKPLNDLEMAELKALEAEFGNR